MKSLIKTSISIDTVQKILDKAVENEGLDVSDPKVLAYSKIENGYFNIIYSLQLIDLEVILKIAPTADKKILRYENNIMQAEVMAIEYCTRCVNARIPKIFYYDNSKELLECEYLIMEKLEGRPLNEIESELSAEELFKIEKDLGVMNREINQISGEKFGYLTQPDKQSKKWSEAFYSILSDIIIDGKNENVNLPYTRIDDIVRKLLYTLDDVKQPKLIHWDLWKGNVLVKDKKVSGIIDFERALWADPLMEYYFSPLSESEGFYSGYGISLNKLDENAKIRRMLYNLYIFLVLKIECFYRGYIDSDQNNWAEDEIIKCLNSLEGIVNY